MPGVRSPMRRAAQSERGSALALTVALLPMLLALLGLVVDAGLYGLQYVQASGAADAGALAAASAVDKAWYGATGQVRIDPLRAQQLAEAFARANSPVPVTVVTTVGATQPNQVQVTVESRYSPLFLKIFSINTVSVHGESLASVSHS